MNIELCPYNIYEEILLLDLHIQEPRTGCAARTQIITDFLNAKKLVTGRAWVLPLEYGTRIDAPIEDVDGKPLSFRKDDPIQGRLTWPWHVAPTSETQSGEKIVFDLALYNGPVSWEVWKKSFADQPVEILLLGQNEPPRYSWAGSYYTPELQHEHRAMDYGQEARMELDAIKRQCTDPSFIPPSHRPFIAPRIEGLLIKRAW